MLPSKAQRGKRSSLFFRVLLMLSLLALFGCPGETVAEFQTEGRKLMEQGNPGGAVVFFKNALEKDPTDFSIRFDLGKAYFKSGKLEQAEEEFKKCLLQQPGNTELNVEMARLSLMMRRPEQALDFVAKAEKSGGPTPDTRELAALTLSLLGKVDESEQALKQALEIDPNYKSASVALARVYLAQRRPKEAMELSDKIIAANPDYQDGLRLRADIALRTNDQEKAASLYKRLVQIDPNDLGANYQLGTVLLSQGNIEEAKRVRNSMQARFKSSPLELMLSGMIAFQEGEFSEAATLFQNSVNARPTVDGYYRLAMALNRAGNKESALSNLRKILDNNPQNGLALQLTAQILLDQGRLVEAREEAERLTLYYPDNAAGHYLLGTILNAEGKNDESLKELDKALALNPAMSEAAMRRSSVLMAEHRFTEAAEGLAEAIKTDSGNIPARVALFNYYLGRNDQAQAGRVVDEGLAEQPGNSVLLTLKALLYANQKNDALAMETLKQARQADPDLLAAVNLALRLHLLAGRTQEALDVCDDYLSRHPEAVEQLLVSASLLDSLNRPEDATARLQKALQLGENRALVVMVRRELIAKRPEQAEKLLVDELQAKQSPQLRVLLADFYVSQKQPDKALAVYSAVEQSEALEAANGQYRIFIATDKNDEALAKAREIKKLAPNSIMGYLYVSEVLERTGKAGDALEELDNAYRFLNEPSLLVAMGNICMRSQQYDKADTYFRTALSRTPKEKQALSGRAYIMMHKKDYSSAVDLYEQIAALDPTDVTAFNNLAMALAEEGKNTDRAVDLATKAFVVRPDNPQILDTLAYCLMADKRDVEAVNVLKNGIAAHPDSAILRFRYGAALIQTGQKQEGLAELEKSLTLGSFSEEQAARDMIKKNR